MVAPNHFGRPSDQVRPPDHYGRPLPRAPQTYVRPPALPPAGGGGGTPPPAGPSAPPTPDIRDVNDPGGPGIPQDEWTPGGHTDQPGYQPPQAPPHPADFGLSFLPPPLFEIWRDAYIRTGSAAQALEEMRAHDMYEQFYPGNRSANGLIALSEKEYEAYVLEAMNLAGDYGMSEEFGSREYVGRFIGGGLSINEVRERFESGFVASSQADPNLVSQLQEYYGATPGDIAAFFLDPDTTQSVLQRRYQKAQLSAIGITSGFGSLSQDQAGRMFGMGVGDRQAREGFSTLVQQRSLFTPLMGQRGASIGRDNQLDAVFGQDADALMSIQRERQRRLAEFQGGGGAAASSSNLAGFRTSTL